MYSEHICSDEELHGVATVTVEFLEYNTVSSALTCFFFFFFLCLHHSWFSKGRGGGGGARWSCGKGSHFGPSLIAKIDLYLVHLLFFFHGSKYPKTYKK